MMGSLVTIAIPIYKRLEYLPGVLRAVELQNYPNIELIVSDNGQNGSKVTELIDRHFSRPYRFRQNAVTVNIPSHYHQILSEATGEYFIWLADDDLISPNFVSELAGTLENHPEVSVAIARQEIIDTTGRVVRRSSEDVPVFLSGEEFIRSWTKYKYENYSTLLARTEDLKTCGGFANFPRGTASDDAIMIKLCLKGSVAFNTRCAFQYRWHETSHGFSISLQQLADDLKNFLRFLDSDPIIRSYAAKNPTQWTELKATLVTMTWQTYHSRWDTLYRERLALVPWVKAAFALPYIPDYYRAVRSSLRHGVKEKLFKKAKAQFPWIHKLYRTIKRRTF